jgi:hypothetical protein
VPLVAAADEFQTTTGPFRVSLLSLHREHELVFVDGPWVWVDEDGHQRPIEKRLPRGATGAAGPMFLARFRITSGPSHPFRLDGAPSLAEAVDDQDQSLEAAPEEPSPKAKRANPARGAFTTLDLRLPLSLPEQPGKAIKRLRGVIPVVAASRAPEPVSVISVSDAKGKTVTAGDATITITTARVESDQRAVITFTARLAGEKGNFRDPAYQTRVSGRLVDIAQQSIEVLDDQSRSIRTYPGTSIRRNEVRVTLRTMPGEDVGAPDRLRVFGLNWTATEIPCDFKDVPMP